MILYRVAEGGPFDLQVDNGVIIENVTDDLVNAKILIPVVIEQSTVWCFEHDEEVFTQAGTDTLICARYLRSPCDIAPAAVVRLEDK